jgi:hypothetical protein
MLALYTPTACTHHTTGLVSLGEDSAVAQIDRGDAPSSDMLDGMYNRNYLYATLQCLLDVLSCALMKVVFTKRYSSVANVARLQCHTRAAVAYSVNKQLQGGWLL